MLKSHEKFHSANGRRLILIADDEVINRELLGMMLEDEYEILYAEDGLEALQAIRDNADTLSLVLLDLMMPKMKGQEVLRQKQSDEAIRQIPVIVLTADQEAEIECLELGAIDFIPKPYPTVGVIKARLRRTIELSEDRDIIQSTERDVLTGLYNKDFFFRYAEQYDQFHKGVSTDAIVLDVNHFRMINERYGRPYGDSVLRRVGDALRNIVGPIDGIACRKEADAFLVYCPHREDYEEMLEEISASITDETAPSSWIRLRMGVYANVDKGLEVERRFDRAKMASDTVKDTLTKSVGFYDEGLHEQQLYLEQLVEEFPYSILQNHFKVYYQPKFDVRPDTPILTSAEALIRWEHPTLGMISPGVFIPLFEENGLIQRLDRFVWQETARQIREWKDQLGYSVPVSVNVSRVDLFDSNLPEILEETVQAHGLQSSDIYLEITESAYTQEHGQIVEAAKKLRRMGFQIEMDDFGTGYSSLNMLSNLPIDALKLDMQFIRSAFKDDGNTHMLEVVIGIADFMSIPVIAEGVETEEQLHVLKALGCDIVQGYFFSRPVPAAEFEPFILQKKEADLIREQEPVTSARKEAADEAARKESLNRLTEEPGKGQVSSEVATAYIPSNDRGGIHLRTASICFVVLAFIAALALLISDMSVSRGYERMEAASDRYIAAQLAASNLESGSDYLTDRVRCFVVTGSVAYLEDFVEEVTETKRRDKAVESLEELLGDSNSSAVDSLNTALSLSNELVDYENKAMRLILETGDYDMSTIPEDIASIELTDEERSLSDEELKERAQTLVFSNDYMHYKDRIRENVALCTQALIRTSSQELEQASAQLALLVRIQTGLTVVFLAIVVAIVIMITRLVRKPLTDMVRKMQEQQEITPTGVEELRFVIRTYNKLLEENKASQEKLSHEASHDALTGLFNRGAYDLLMESTDREHMALILIDVDYFKGINDTYGHAVGDKVLKRVAELMKHSFRSVDILCRIGGDEFVVVMTRVNSTMSKLVQSKIERINDLLQHPKDGLPPVSLSVGVAFSDRENPKGDIFRDADTALYQVKEAGRNGCKIFDGSE
ncbi:MAG: EAL domain-containing protein [Eggerthellaceae bacterium]|nr:EAL domain-containing protein [Eggerthellaceae bacterium]